MHAQQERYENLDLAMQELLEAYKQKNNQYGFEKFFKVENYSTFVFESSHASMMNKLRILNLKDSIVKKWVNSLEQEFKIRYSATPKNYNWYKRNFVFAEANFESNIPTCFSPDSEALKCNACAQLQQQKYFPNFSEKCTENFIIRLKKSANSSRVEGSLKNSRFFLMGRAGEGKTAFINYLLSAKQNFFWNNKLINIKLNFTDDWIMSKIENIIKKENYKNEKDKEDKIKLSINKFIKNLINLKVLRILKTHYFSYKTKINISEELADTLETNQNKKILESFDLCIERGNSSDSRFSKYSFLIYTNEKGKMGDDVKKEIKKHININHEWLNKIDILHAKSQHTLSKKDVANIKVNAIDKLNGLSDNQKKININLLNNNQLAKNYYDEVNGEMIQSICNLLHNLEYDFCIILDGLDAHYNIGSTDFSIKKILSALIDITFKPKDNNKIYGSYVIASREETKNKLLKDKVFPGSLWGDLQTIELVDVSTYEIVHNRLKQASTNSKYEYYKNFHESFLNMCTHHININLTDNYNTKQDIVYKNADLVELNLLFKNNKRKLISFFELYFKEIFFKLEQNGLLNETTIDKKKMINKNIDIYFNFIKNKSYLFWNPVIYKNYKMYQNHFTYCLNNNELDRKIKQNIDTVTYGHFPNLFNFINLGGKDYIKNNKFFLRLRILQILDIKSQPLNLLKSCLAKYYNIDEKEVNWEIDELIKIYGVIDVEERGEDDCQLKTNQYWVSIREKIFYRQVLSGIMPVNNLPNYNIFKKFLTYVSINDSVEHKIKREDVFFAELVLIVYFYAYFLHLEESEKQLYFTKNNQLIKLFNPGQEISFDQNFSVAKKIKKVLDNITNHHNNLYGEKLRKRIIAKIDLLIQEIETS